MSCRSGASLYFIAPNTTMTGPKYVELLKDTRKLHLHVDGCTIFTQDGASCDRLKVSSEFLRSESRREPVDYNEG